MTKRIAVAALTSNEYKTQVKAEKRDHYKLRKQRKQRRNKWVAA